ncbi:hypothetical protein COCSUDRAFT_47820 [Coccomyxa subellipsoidea C-169]|uniref:Uncharacterized protein n=1 Tax=Coccomyxa subellipsoidea (strain C-169) TaxID=574566 RepID=I0YV82_COCSC|nr:hypothetical protein COCSUDRAFT_47820 [Coccomyxa subellipsoidea C-169]EIE22301.1 hypothetical protein COCSUDRAFT_47820 [Coccomyxa subellipsoidea C-169]|eukprot:XP_005646845.1 hypothetical protein COCSUDRAFT_47820 [Coccomyxa subellipsoidea C-169]
MGQRSQPALLLCLLSILLSTSHISAQPGFIPPMPPLGFFGGLLDTFGIGSSTDSPSPPPATRTMTPATASAVTSPQATIATSSDLAPLRTPAAAAAATPVPVSTAAAKPATTPAPVAVGTFVPAVTTAPAAVPVTPAAVAVPAATVKPAAAAPVATVAPANALPVATPAATLPAAAAAVPLPQAVPTPVPTPAGSTVVITPAGTRMVPMPPQIPPLRPPIPTAASPPPPVASPPPAQPPPPPPLAMVPLPAALAPLLSPSSKATARSPSPSPPAPYVVRDPAATALAAELLLQGPGVWPFDSAKQALLVSAIASVLPGIGPGAVSITGSGAPFRRRLLQESALVDTQIDAGSADRVPLVREQLQNATSSGQLQGALRAAGLGVTGVQLQAATAVVPAPKDSSGGMMTSTIVGLSVAAFVAVLLAAGAYYVCVHKQCLSWSNRVAAAADAEQPKGATTPKEGTRVKPFYEAPQFAQTYARTPSLVQQRPPLPPAMHRARADGGRGGQIRQG